MKSAKQNKIMRTTKRKKKSNANALARYNSNSTLL